MSFNTNTVAELAAGIGGTTLDSTNTSKKPYLVFATCPADGHTNPIVRVAAELVRRGFEATFIGGLQFEDIIRATGAHFVGLPPVFTPKIEAERNLLPAGIPRLLYDVRHVFINKTPEHWMILKDVLEELRAKDSEREIVLVPETFYMGVNPLSLGAPLPKGFITKPKVVNLHVVPYVASSIDTAPGGPGLPPDSTESGRARNQLLNQMMVAGPWAELIAHQDSIFKELGTTELLETQVPFHHWMLIHDVTLHMCPPSLEYPRSDKPSHVKFAGCLEPKPVPDNFAYPSWWEDVTRGDRRIIAVTQGTIARDYSDLIIPTMQALADRDDFLVVVILGMKEASLPAGTAIPSNTRVIDYLTYDVLLPYTSVFVMNAGYGGFLHGVTHGVPLVLAGETEDKPEIAMRGEWSGVAINLRTGRPHPDKVSAAVERVLADESFKKRVNEVRLENEAMKVYDIIEREILTIGDADV
ncbi:hypothetical protein FZEAL_5643 [Fusarium zealandicum]|uniref:Erythromycin biosynthesis protein CIII-like C-terminal domain-containing protein n=1 Tax=Fusarium zealandicum TaxID=1053134 RepID=A0A8H4UJR5_9HYPO|nr:hypothetical protein FZEAL_5643 [Fusarium zealandicum]